MFDILSYRYSQLPEPTLWALSFLAICLGGAFGALLRRGSAVRLRRSVYFLGVSAATLALSVNQVWWLLYVPAVKAGLSGIFPVTDLIGALAYGVVLAQLALARSRDAYGDGMRAWMAFVPAIALILLFKPSLGPQGQPANRGAVVAGLILLFLSRAATTALQDGSSTVAEQVRTDPATAAAINRIALQAGGLEPGLDDLIAREAAPQQIDADLALTKVTRTGTAVTYLYTLNDPSADRLGGAYRASVTAGFCDALMLYLNQGATFDVVR
jgi:hypothetical protein